MANYAWSHLLLLFFCTAFDCFLINFLLSFFFSSPYSDPNLIIVLIVVLSNCPSTVKAKPLGGSSSSNRQGTGMARADRNQMNNIGKETVKTLEVAFGLMKLHLPEYVSSKKLMMW